MEAMQNETEVRQQAQRRIAELTRELEHQRGVRARLEQQLEDAEAEYEQDTEATETTALRVQVDDLTTALEQSRHRIQSLEASIEQENEPQPHQRPQGQAALIFSIDRESRARRERPPPPNGRRRRP